MDMEVLRPALPMFWVIAERNSVRARRLYLRACGTAMDTGELLVENGSIAPEPSDGGHTPARQDPPLISPRPLDAIHSGADRRYTVQMEVGIAQAQTPKRPGGPMDTSSDKGARAARDIEEATTRINLKDSGLLSRGDKHIR